MEQSTSGEANRCLDTYVVHTHSMELEGSLPFTQYPAHVSVLSQMNPIYVVTFYLRSS